MDLQRNAQYKLNLTIINGTLVYERSQTPGHAILVADVNTQSLLLRSMILYYEWCRI